MSLDNGGTVTNSSSITGGEDGVIIAGTAGLLTNTGSITATVDDGVNFIGTVINGIGGSISAPTGLYGGAGVYTPSGLGNVQNDDAGGVWTLSGASNSIANVAEATVLLPDMAPTFAPIVYAVPIQLLAYHTAVSMGTDVDQPRNLAKSVTVE